MNEKFLGRREEVGPKIDPELEREVLENKEVNSITDEFEKYD